MAISIKPTPASVRREISGMHAAPTVSLQILAPLASGNRVLMPALALLAGLLLAAVGRPIHATEAEPLDPINVPTDAPPSPLFGAQPFTQKMLLFEEFGLQPMPTVAASPDTVLPPPRDCLRGPEDGPLDAFLAKSLFPLPTQEAYLGSPNPWETQIKGCIPGVTRTFMEGRPPGEFFAHQRWTEFFPQVFFQSAMAGARDNGGLRDPYQRHGYVTGEFGENGLYFLPNGSTKGIKVKFHPSMPEQNLNSVWTFDGTFPPKLLMARYGESILFRHHDALPISPAANNGFGTHTITTHEHNGHSPAESDGYTHAFFFPGQYYDYHWPMILAGHDRINAGAADPRAAMPNGIGGGSNIPGDWRETMSSHWFHDHMLDFTAQNVYKGNAAMMNYYSAVDRGREPRDQAEANGNPATPGYGCHYANEANVNLCLPSGNGLDWGNRDYDVNLLIADKAWNQAGQLYFNVFNRDGFLGDVMTVNWLYKPYMEVRARRYRFRMLNAAVSRYFKIALVDQEGRRAPFHMVANDGNLMEHAVKFETAELPQIGIAERYDIVVDFRNFKEGDTLYFVNLLEHANGRGPQRELPLADVLSGFYQSDPLGLGVDPAVGKFLEFRVKAYAGNDLSMNPADYEEGGKKMIPLPNFTAAELQNAKHRHFEFGRDATDADAALDKPWTIVTDHALRPDGTRDGHTMDPHRLSAAPDEGAAEIWHLRNGGEGWSHPVHIHFEEGRIISRDDKPPQAWDKWARKDVYRLGPFADSGRDVVLAIRFREFMGTYMEHCHNTQHEDKAMLLRWDVQDPNKPIRDPNDPNNTLIALPTPMPDWNGVAYEDTFTLETYKTGDVLLAQTFELPDGFATADPPPPPPPPPVATDTIVVTRASLTKRGVLRVEGTVTPFTGGTKATVFNGVESNGVCSGATLGSADIRKSKGKGVFRFQTSVKGLVPPPATVCAASPGGDADQETVRLR